MMSSTFIPMQISAKEQLTSRRRLSLFRSPKHSPPVPDFYATTRCSPPLPLRSNTQCRIDQLFGNINSDSDYSRKRESPNNNLPVYVIPKDGVYLLIVYIGSPVSLHPYSASVHLEMKSTSPDGYLSITDYPLLPFYGVMCGVYVLLGNNKT